MLNLAQLSASIYASPQTQTLHTPTPTPTPPTPSSSPFKAPDTRPTWPTWSPRWAITGNYAPLLLARLVLLILQALYAHLETWEPLRLLTSPHGISGPALAGTRSWFLHIGLLAADIGSTFAVGITTLDTNYCGLKQMPGDLNPCPPRVSLVRWAGAVVLAALVVQVLVLGRALAKWFQRPGRMWADPTTIAGVAVVMGHPVVEAEFAAIPAEMTQRQLQEWLKGRRFKLGEYMTEQGLRRYGIVPVEEERPRSRKTKRRSKSGASFRAKFSALWSSKPSRLIQDLLFLALLLALFILTIVSVGVIEHPQTIFHLPSLSPSIGTRILLALLGSLVSAYWARLFRETQTATPYRPLRSGEARPAPTILLHRHSSPVTALIPLVRHGHAAAASVAVTALLAELLVVALAGLPYRPGQLRGEFLFCGIVAAVLLMGMMGETVGVYFWRRRLPTLPRRTDTIAGVMTYVAGTDVVRALAGLEECSVRRRDEVVKAMEKMYVYGWREDEGRGGRWVVDEVGNGGVPVEKPGRENV